MDRVDELEGDYGGNMAQWIAYLPPEPVPGSIPSISKIVAAQLQMTAEA